jgi:hypothetical protein
MAGTTATQMRLKTSFYRVHFHCLRGVYALGPIHWREGEGISFSLLCPLLSTQLAPPPAHVCKKSQKILKLVSNRRPRLLSTFALSARHLVSGTRWQRLSLLQLNCFVFVRTSGPGQQYILRISFHFYFFGLRKDKECLMHQLPSVNNVSTLTLKLPLG